MRGCSSQGVGMHRSECFPVLGMHRCRASLSVSFLFRSCTLGGRVSAKANELTLSSEQLARHGRRRGKRA